MKQLLILFLFLILITAACSVLTLQPANFSWPLESVLPVDDNGPPTIGHKHIGIEGRTMLTEALALIKSKEGNVPRLLFQDHFTYRGIVGIFY